MAEKQNQNCLFANKAIPSNPTPRTAMMSPWMAMKRVPQNGHAAWSLPKLIWYQPLNPSTMVWMNFSAKLLTFLAVLTIFVSFSGAQQVWLTSDSNISTPRWPFYSNWSTGSNRNKGSALSSNDVMNLEEYCNETRRDQSWTIFDGIGAIAKG